MEYDLATTISDVTVYPDRALVSRRGEIAIDAAGEHLLRLGGLPLMLQRDSLRARGRGPAGMRILGVEEDVEYHEQAPEEALQRLRDEIKRLEGEIAALDTRIIVADDQRNWLATLAQQSSRSMAWALARGSATVEDASHIVAYTSEETQRLLLARLDLHRSREDLRATLAARQREYSELGGQRQADRMSAGVRVETTQPGTIEITLSYIIFGASWRPRYDAAVNSATERVRLTQGALITQRTGEDWPNAALALSTARPFATITLPDEPDPWYVDVVQPPALRPRMAYGAPIAKMTAMPTPGASASMSDVSEGTWDGGEYPTVPPPPPPVEAEMSVAEAERSGVAQVFRLPRGVNIPTDGSPHLVSIGGYDLPCRLEYVAMPQVAEGAQLLARATNTTGGVLPAGELHIFHTGEGGDEYVGATHLDLTAEGAEMALYLGVDDNITVKRELVERDTDKGSILQSGVRRITYGYRVTLANRTNTPQRLAYKDRLPVPRHERIKLRVLDLKPQPTTRTRLEQLTWELRLAPGEERRIEWRFIVEAPSDLNLSGLL